MELKSLKNVIYVIVLLQFTLQVCVSSPVITSENELIRPKRWLRAIPWTNATLYYKIACTDYTEEELANIKSALQGIMNKTCVKFIEINDTSEQKNYVNLSCVVRGSCVSKLGMVGGAQHMNLARIKTKNPLHACLSNRKIQHEFLHALGFKHEHNSIYRDNYIEIQHNNVAIGMENYFAKHTEDSNPAYGCEFDYNSVMMPPTWKYSINGLPTILPKDKKYTVDTMGIAPGISECDITRINNMYCNHNMESENIIE